MTVVMVAVELVVLGGGGCSGRFDGLKVTVEFLVAVVVMVVLCRDVRVGACVCVRPSTPPPPPQIFARTLNCNE